MVVKRIHGAVERGESSVEFTPALRESMRRGLLGLGYSVHDYASGPCESTTQVTW